MYGFGIIVIGHQSEFVKQDSHLSDVEENVMLARVGHVRGEVLAHYTVPVRRVLHVKELLNRFCDLFFCVGFVNSGVNLLLDVLLHVGRHFADYPLDVSFCHFSLI